RGDDLAAGAVPCPDLGAADAPGHASAGGGPRRRAARPPRPRASAPRSLRRRRLPRLPGDRTRAAQPRLGRDRLRQRALARRRVRGGLPPAPPQPLPRVPPPHLLLGWKTHCSRLREEAVPVGRETT